MGYLNEDGLATLVGKVKGQVVQLTSAEYRNLPASKNSDNKTYFVTDEDYAYAIDDKPTLNSDNLVKSGGVYTYTSKIGSGTLSTTAQTIIPAINELDAEIDTINTDLTELKTATIINSSQMTHVSTTSFEGTIVVRAGVMLGFLIFSPTNDISATNGDIVTGGIPNVITSVQLPLVCVAGADSGKAGRVRWINGKIQAWYSNLQPKAGSTYLISIYGVAL